MFLKESLWLPACLKTQAAALSTSGPINSPAGLRNHLNRFPHTQMPSTGTDTRINRWTVQMALFPERLTNTGADLPSAIMIVLSSLLFIS